MNPYELDLWLLAAYYEFDVLKNPFNARKIFYKALKVLKNNKVLSYGILFLANLGALPWI
jgi:hypothetical protein